MRDDELIFLCLLGIGLICAFVSIFITIYLGRTKIKEIDRVVLGYEISSDNILHLGIRMMNYGGAFAWRWSAQRSGILPIRDHFDKKFQRPFIINYWLVFAGTFFLALAILWQKLFLNQH